VHCQLQDLGTALADNNDCDCDEHEEMMR
jgi:hypothetical protein